MLRLTFGRRQAVESWEARAAAYEAEIARVREQYLDADAEVQARPAADAGR